jgi:hypothetical protein
MKNVCSPLLQKKSIVTAQRPVRSAAGGFIATFGFGLRLAESSS